LGLEDVLIIPVEPDELQDLAKGDLARDRVRHLYQSSVKVPPYSWPPRPASGHGEPLLGKGRLRGVWLLPVTRANGGWRWEGEADGKPYVIRYDPEKGLVHGGGR
jgi:hypothetical protein